MATLTISISEGSLARLRERACAEGTTPEAILAAAAETDSPVSPPGTELWKLAGIIDSERIDGGERHDESRGGALADGKAEHDVLLKSATDPFMQLAGCFSSGVPDAA